MESEPKFVNWVKPDVSHEIGEIERTSKTLGIPIDKIKIAIEKAEIVNLDDQVWSLLENTDSCDVQSLEDVARLADQVSRDYKAIAEAYLAGKPMQSPIVIRHGNTFHLISGNTRLMVARALNIAPKVLICEI